MTVGSLDRRLAVLLAGSLALIAVLRFVVFADRGAAVVVPTQSVAVAEKRLEHLRQLAAMVKGKEEVLKAGQAELDTREAGVLKADTRAQAQAQLIDRVQAMAKSYGIDSHGVERMAEAVVSNDYGEVSVEVAFTCGIEQLVNLLAGLADDPQILATNQIRISGGTDKKKNIQVRLFVTGIVPRKLFPEKKPGATS
jgi:hypothetical protein